MLKEILSSKNIAIAVTLLCGIGIINSCTKDKIAPVVINTEVGFSKDIYPVFKSSEGHCSQSGCHADAASPPDFSSLDSCYTTLLRDTSYNLEQRVLYVNVEHPDSSYLYIKLTQNNPAYGGRMPLDGPYLSSEFTSKVLTWIKQGAHKN